MPLSPLDLQSSIGHTHDVARMRQIETEQASLQQHNLDSKSLQDSQKIKDTVVQPQKTEEIPNSFPENKSGKRRYRRREDSDDENLQESAAPDLIENPQLGTHIDVTR